ncbi:MAG: hypothetical protein H7X80_00610 [bacterium]|nr:hypothetical protein [Candidatus Kapabacteria bacterium]
MKDYANALWAVVALFFIAASTATAQAPPTHPDPTAVLIGSFTVTISVNGGAVSFSRFGATMSSAATENCQVTAGATVWRTSTGQIDYIIDPASIQFSGDCGSADLTPSEIFGQLAAAAIARGIQLEFSSCNPDCSAQQHSRVYSALCVRQVGSGNQTQYIACDMTSMCYREYIYCCPNGIDAPEVTEVPREGEGCGPGDNGPCQPTCGPRSPWVID